MADTRKPADPTASGERHSRDLQKVNERLRDLVASLRTEKERLSAETRSLASVAAAIAPATPAAPAKGPGAAQPESEPADLEKKRLATELALAREAVAHATEERERLRERLTEIEKENQRICDEYVAVQEQSSELAQLYVALERIHGGASRGDTLAALQEIVINVIGSEELAVLDLRGDQLVLAQSFGIDPEPYRDLPIGDGAIGRAARGETYVAGRAPAAAGEEDITACVPLRTGDAVVGVLVVFRLLGHKPGLDPIDHAMFDLLSAHAGIALELRARARPA